MSNFVSIDFELANSKKDSPCSVGVVKVVDNVIVDAFYSLIDPETTNWNHYCMEVHKITSDHVKGQPKFDEVWMNILPMLEGVDFIVGHNVSFEKSIIDTCCEKYKLPKLDIMYKCSMRDLAKNVYKLSSVGLDKVCEVFGFDIDHHNALSDAVASARLVINFYKDKEVGKRFGKYKLSVSEEKILKNKEFLLKDIAPLYGSQTFPTYKQCLFLLQKNICQNKIRNMTKGEATKEISKIINDHTNIERKCEFCQNIFVTIRHNQIYCSTKCSEEKAKWREQQIKNIQDHNKINGKDIDDQDVEKLLSIGCSKTEIARELKLSFLEFDKRFISYQKMSIVDIKNKTEALMKHFELKSYVASKVKNYKI